jgi:hypothetical protein
VTSLKIHGNSDWFGGSGDSHWRQFFNRRRIRAGEKTRDLAMSYGVSISTISRL